ncbi:WW domain-containing oxidoreductase 2 [Colletotrichum chlorophyti]|uniref:WW domain-containing oxidoreductase 2 n=1 Tax=Colletotrichum chlorophyti TaxID=708187 RepID=A0A1Q8RZK4_9PEZI|nr:WW domain-containing oxidoreductase 2 [Colletotrichum chlorophyti]
MTLSRYAAVHASPQGAGDARPTAEEVLRDQNLVGNHWPDKTVLITGGTAGIGAESARVLHLTGAKIFITGRDLAKGERVAEEISAANPHYPPVEMIELDQSNLRNVRHVAAEFLKRSGGKLNLLLANAGIMGCPQSKTEEGFETAFTVNHLAHFLLFQLLRPALVASSAPSFHSRVVIVSSSGHRASNINPDNYHFEGDGVYDSAKTYAQSKTANILMANEIERRYGKEGVHGLSLNPGLILTTEIGRDFSGSVSSRREEYLRHDALLARHEKSLEQGAATQVWASVAKELEGKGGLYLDDVQVGREAEHTEQPKYYLPGWQKWIWDENMASRLWEDSLNMVQFSQNEE